MSDTNDDRSPGERPSTVTGHCGHNHSPHESAMLQAALCLASLGFAVFPVHGIRPDGCCTCGNASCQQAGKHPIFKGGYKIATSDAAKIRQWWRQHPNANIAVATGARSGAYVLDVDPRHGGDLGFAELEQAVGGLPETLVASTGGGGRHLFFAAPAIGGTVKNGAKIGGFPGVDFRGDGGYVVAAPSRHLSGGTYRWNGPPEEWADRLPPLPQAMVDLISAKLDRPARTGGKVEAGSRNQTLTSHGGALRRIGMGEAAIAAALAAENVEAINEPLDEREVGRIAASVARYAPDAPITKAGAELVSALAMVFRQRGMAQASAIAGIKTELAERGQPLDERAVEEMLSASANVTIAPSLPNSLARYTYIKAIDAVWDSSLRAPVAVKAVSRSHAAEMPADENGKRADPVKALVAAGQKADVLVYEPGAPTVIESGGVRSLNTWQPGSLAAVAGDVGPFLGHVGYLLDGDQAAQGYLLDWMAHLVQHPGVKMRTATVIIGGQGIGKTLLGTILTRMVGAHNATTVEASDLRSQFNEWADGTQLVVVNEMAAMDSADLRARLKAYVSDDTLRINRKGVSTYKYRNAMNFMMFANPGTKLHFEEGDRRYFVWRSAAIRNPPAYYSDLITWLDAGGDAAVLHLLSTHDLTGFNPNAPAPLTAAKEAIVSDSRPPAEAVVIEMIDAAAPPFHRDLVRVMDVVALLAKRSIHVNPVEAGATLRAVGAEELGQKRLRGEKVRLWAVRNVQRWKKAAEGVIAQHMAVRAVVEGLEGLEDLEGL